MSVKLSRNIIFLLVLCSFCLIPNIRLYATELTQESQDYDFNFDEDVDYDLATPSEADLILDEDSDLIVDIDSLLMPRSASSDEEELDLGSFEIPTLTDKPPNWSNEQYNLFVKNVKKSELLDGDSELLKRIDLQFNFLHHRENRSHIFYSGLDLNFGSGARVIPFPGTDLQKLLNVKVTIPKKCIPSPGKYRLRFYIDLGSGASFSSNQVFATVHNNLKNVSSSFATYSFKIPFSIIKGGSQYNLYFEREMTIGSKVDKIDLIIPISLYDYADDKEIWYLKYAFEPLEYSHSDFNFPSSDNSSGNSSDGSSGGASGSSGSSGGSGGSPGGSSGGASGSSGGSSSWSVSGSTRDVVETISHQIFAFWNQLASEFTNLYYKLDKMARIRQDGFVYEFVNEMESSRENDNKNTEELKNGYDNSQMNASNQALQGALDEQKKAEAVIDEAVSDNLSNFNFDFENPVFKYVNVISGISDWLQELYESLGPFSSVVQFILFLNLALMFIGYYRIKGGS